MFQRILIANRGEIALRVIRTCHELGIETVAVYSEADRDALHVKMSDRAICIGPASPVKSYLNAQNILSAAVLSGAEAIHPGFGFLSENHEFARQCEDIGIRFIGPDSRVIHQLGQKLTAKTIMAEHGLASIPGSSRAYIDAEEALIEAQKIGFPLVIKAVSGGGGRGIRLIREPADFQREFQEASHEAKIAFKDPFLYIEKFLENPKHIEFQILADGFGNCIHLGERDCSCQRRKQKIIEETPSPVIRKTQREEIGKKITSVLAKIGYTSAGTIEFLYESGNFYFMEMNTRIQVEHPISEMVSGIDIVREQIRIAAGEELAFKQKEVILRGHAIECRINAEDPARNFLPFSGTVESVIFPGGPGIRVDSAIYPGYRIPPFYDSMIAKIIAFDVTRDRTIAKMMRAINEFTIDGIYCNKNFIMKILQHPEFIQGQYAINFIDQQMPALFN